MFVFLGVFTFTRIGVFNVYQTMINFDDAHKIKRKKEKRQNNAMKEEKVKTYRRVPKCLNMDQQENLIYMKTKQKHTHKKKKGGGGRKIVITVTNIIEAKCHSTLTNHTLWDKIYRI